MNTTSNHTSVDENPGCNPTDWWDADDDELDAMLAEDTEGVLSDDLGLVAGLTPEGFRSGFAALIGRPNAGKSTLLNACLGEKLAITSPVAQTTRTRIRGVVNQDLCQIVFVDTPGLHKPRDPLGDELNRAAIGELDDVDVVALLLDATKAFGRGDAWVCERLAASKVPKVLVLTKADIAGPQQVSEQIAAARTHLNFDDEIVVSATEGFNVDAFISLIARYMPEGPQWYPKGMVSDMTPEMLVAEFVREKVLLRTREEIPHSVGVLCESLTQRRGLVRARALIFVERTGQKGIIIGAGGSMIRSIGIDARRELEQHFNQQVHLELEVKVKPGWRSDVREIQRLGYAFEDA